jgi:shikimate kinase
MSSPRTERIYITGFMASGKSTVGPLLAAQLAYEFIDLDARIEAAEGKSIPEIFRVRGEQTFRSVERRELGIVSGKNRIVAATGGGAVTDPGSLAIMRGSGIMVYLEVPLDVLLRRLRGMKGRPMIAYPDGMPLDEAHLSERITSLLRVRGPLYRQSDIIVDAGLVSPVDTVAAILTLLHPLHARP